VAAISRFFGIVIAMFFDDRDPPHSTRKATRQSGSTPDETLNSIEPLQ
jgi:hypothetical protein